MDSVNGWYPDILGGTADAPQCMTIDVGYVEMVYGIVLQDLSLVDVAGDIADLDLLKKVFKFADDPEIYGANILSQDYAVTEVKVEVSLEGTIWKQVLFYS